MVDYRLQSYWTYALAWHRTKAASWKVMLVVLADSDGGPAGKAAGRLVDAAA